MRSIAGPEFWIVFNVLVLIVLAIDLFAMKEGSDGKISIRKAAIWSVVWVALSFAFAGYLAIEVSSDVAMQFVAVYLIEKSLSVDNLFVFLLIFQFFKLTPHLQRRVLLWGILGAIFMRAGFIFAGAVLVHSFSWTLYIFGAILLFTSAKMIFGKDDEIDPEDSAILRIFRRFIPTTQDMHGDRFFVREDGKLKATPLLAVLVLIETSDVIFAVDSIPAIFAITTDPFIVYTSNICAILGLRALYFVLMGMLERFRYLKYGLAVILAFVGFKILAIEWIKIPIGLSLGVIGAILGITMWLSWRAEQKEENPA